MKLVFFSGDKREVERVGQTLVGAGIRCQVRDCRNSKATRRNPRETELWVVNDADCSKAFLLCVEEGVGFGKPTARSADTPLWDESLLT